MFLDVEGLFEDGNHLGIFLKLIEVFGEYPERLDHHLLGEGHHLFKFKFAAKNHILDGSMDVFLKEILF